MKGSKVRNGPWSLKMLVVGVLGTLVLVRLKETGPMVRCPDEDVRRHHEDERREGDQTETVDHAARELPLALHARLPVIVVLLVGQAVQLLQDVLDLRPILAAFIRVFVLFAFSRRSAIIQTLRTTWHSRQITRMHPNTRILHAHFR